MKRLFLASFLLAPVFGWACSIGQINFEHAYVRAVPQDQKNTAGYILMTNACAEPMELVKVTSSAAERVELHETVTKNGVASMKPLDSLILPPNEVTKLAPGTKHLMLIGLTSPLKVGSSIALTFQFKDGSSKTIAVPVKDMRGSDTHEHM